MEKVKKQLKIILLCLIAYTIGFLIAPIIFKNYYPWTWEADVILHVTCFFIAVIGMLKVSRCIIYWLIGDIVYCLMILVYHPAGAYGIGMRGLFAATVYTKETDILELIIMFVLVAVIQIFAEIVVKIIRGVQKRLAKDKNQNQDVTVQP